MTDDNVQGMEFSEPFWSIYNEPNVHVYMDMDEHIDYYKYYDAPISIEFWLTIEEMEKLIGILQDYVTKAKELEPPVEVHIERKYSDEQLRALKEYFSNE